MRHRNTSVTADMRVMLDVGRGKDGEQDTG